MPVMVRRYDIGTCGSWETIDDVAQSYVEISGYSTPVWSLECGILGVLPYCRTMKQYLG
jgi:hypothetical protein